MERIVRVSIGLTDLHSASNSPTARLTVLCTHGINQKWHRQLLSLKWRLRPVLGDYGVVEICTVIYSASYAVRRHTL